MTGPRDAAGGRASAARLFEGEGEVRALARTLDWGVTPLGWPDEWSPALRIAARAMLDAAFPICLWAGPRYALVYNDAYRRILAAKHPAALGRPGSEVWSEIWDGLEAQFEQVRAGGAPVYQENARFEMARLEGGLIDSAWFSYSLSALRDEDGQVVAILNISPETTGRVQAERALTVERARLQEVFRSAPSFIVAYRGPRLVYEFVNDAYYQIVGHRELLGRPLLEALPEIAGQGFDDLLNGVRETGERWVGREVPVLLQRTPGAPQETRYLDMVFQPLTDADGTRSGVVAHGGDITEQVLARREAERARDRADRMQRLTEALAATRTADAVADIIVAQAVDAAGATTGMLSLRAPDPEGEGAGLLVTLRQTGLPDDVSSQFTRYPVESPTPSATSVRTGRAFFLEDRASLDATFPRSAAVFDRIGSQALATVPLTAGGEIVGAMTFTFAEARAIPPEDRELFLTIGRQAAQALERLRLSEAERTARTRAESLQRVTAALAQARTLAEVGLVFSREIVNLVGATTTWVGLLRADGAAVEALGWAGFPDAAVERWRRLSIDEPIALTDVVRGGRPQFWPSREALAQAYPHRASLIRALPQEGMVVLPLPGDAEDGEEAPARGGIVVGFASPQWFDTATRAYFMALAQQCGQAVERARAYEAEQAARLEAESANRAKGEFLAVMSHELRTPLNAIGGYAELMAMGVRGPVSPEQQADLERVQRAQRHLLGLINGVLNYAKVEAGAVQYELEPVALDEVLAACEALVAPQTRAKAITLVRETRDAALVVRADREKLQQVILNLLSNAVKFTDAGGRVSLAGRPGAEGTVVVAVADTGRGIPPDHLERVFQPFVQIDASLTRTQEGTGLGLAISRDLARGMGGELSARSTPGEGSTFLLTLPRA